MIDLRLDENARVLELGGGDNPHPRSNVRVDVRDGPQVDFTQDFNEPLAGIGSDEFDVVFCQFALEHVSFRVVPQFLRECLRVLKPGGLAVFVVPNTKEQQYWIHRNPEGWDGKDFFTSASELLFGSQDYPENSHRSYFDEKIAQSLFNEAGFRDVHVSPYGERETDMVVQANKPMSINPINMGKIPTPETSQATQESSTPLTPPQPPPEGGSPRLNEARALPGDGKGKEGDSLSSGERGLTREEMYDRHYFTGGGKVGGYAREGMWDFPIHQVTALHILARKPASVLELGAARGYVLKRIHDAGTPGVGLEISKHCHMTRVTENVFLHDLCQTPWPEQFMLKYINMDLCYSIATLEHVPEEHIPSVIREMARTCKRGLHGIDFGERDDGFDKTHCSLFPKTKWQQLFAEHAPGWPVEVLDKEELERGAFQWRDGQHRNLPEDYVQGDGKTKLNVGCFTNMYHHGWVNLDVNDLSEFARQHAYSFRRHDPREGLPFGTGVVDLISCSHFLDKLTYPEALKLLREFRRVIRLDGALRISVPDARLLSRLYNNSPQGEGTGLEQFDEVNDACDQAGTSVGKLWALLGEGKKSQWDAEALTRMLEEVGFLPTHCGFRKVGVGKNEEGRKQILRETLDTFPCLSLFVDAIPQLG